MALPGLADPNFRQTVVLMCEHNQEGSLGLILNRPTQVELSGLLPKPEWSRGREDFVFEGGPVQKSGLMVLYQGNSVESSVPVFKDVYLSGDLEAVMGEGILGKGSSQIRFYAGYAGWSPQQLEGEVAAGGWKLLPGTLGLVFGEENTSAWPQVIGSVGKEYEIYSEMPPDPSSN